MAIPCTERCSWLQANPCPGKPPRAPQQLEPAGEPGNIAVEVDGKKEAEVKRVQHSGPRRGTAKGRGTSQQGPTAGGGGPAEGRVQAEGGGPAEGQGLAEGREGHR
eukprot:11611620-Heterocapsa_arctica.AAC.1